MQYNFMLVFKKYDRQNTICARIMIGLWLLLSVSKHNMWSYYDWVVVVFRQ